MKKALAFSALPLLFIFVAGFQSSNSVPGQPSAIQAKLHSLDEVRPYHLARSFGFERVLSQTTTLNLSHDLVSLGIAANNMIPNQPSQDAGPLVRLGVAYAMTHQIGRVIADQGTYYFLSLENPFAHVQLGNTPTIQTVHDITIDFQNSTLIFTHTLNYGFLFWKSTNLVLQNFAVDYQPLPFTQVRVVSVDTATAQIQYTVEPGWQDPSAFNTAQPQPGAAFFVVEVHIFRNGRQALNTRRMVTQRPFSGNRFTIINEYGFIPTPQNMSTIRPGDIAVLVMRHYGTSISAYRCRGCTFRNITVYSASSAAIELTHSESSVLERVYSIPKPGTDRLVSCFAFRFQAIGPNNQIRLSRAIRTMDSGFALYTWATGQVESQQSLRTFTVDGTCCALGQGVTIPNGSPVVFQRRSDGAILGSAVIVSQSGSPDVYNPDHLTYTFDRDLPGNFVGTVMYTTDPNQRGANSLIERNLVQDKSCCYGMDFWGWAGSTVRGNYYRRVALAAISGMHSMFNGTWTSPPLIDMTFTRNVIDGTKIPPEWWLSEMGGIQMITFGPDANQNPGLMSITGHQNITINNNFIADPGRAAVWLANTGGGDVSGNYFLHPNERPSLSAYHPPETDVIAPLIVHLTSNGISAANNTVDSSSGIVFVTDAQFRELAAYAPGATIRLNAYNIGTLATPSLTLTDADGTVRPLTIQNTITHALDVQLPAPTALGGAYITLTAGGAKYFGTLFVDGQDNIPALNGCIYEVSVPSTSVPNAATSVPILVLTQAGCSYQAVDSDSFVTFSGGGPGTSIVSATFTANTGAARSTTLEIAGITITLTQAAVGTLTTVSATSFKLGPVAPGEIVAGFGSNLATTDKVNEALPLPTVLEGTHVEITDSAATVHSAGLFGVFKSQVNYLIPGNITLGPAKVRLTSGDGRISIGDLTVVAYSPGIFTANSDGSGAVAGNFLRVTATNEQIYEETAIFNSSTQTYTSRCVDLGPSSESVFIVLYGSGIRGIPSPSFITATIGGTAIPVLAALPHGTYVGVDQINLGPIPRSLISRGIVKVRLVVSGVAMNEVEVCIK